MTVAGLLIIIGLIFILLELIVGIQTGFDLVILGVILIGGGFAGHVFVNTQLALGISIGLCALYIFFGRSVLKSKLIVMARHTNVDKLIGSHGIVVRSITPDTAGLVRVGDEDWRAVSQEILYEKDKIEVESLEGVSLHVRKKN